MRSQDGHFQPARRMMRNRTISCVAVIAVTAMLSFNANGQVFAQTNVRGGSFNIGGRGPSMMPVGPRGPNFHRGPTLIITTPGVIPPGGGYDNGPPPPPRVIGDDNSPNRPQRRAARRGRSGVPPAGERRFVPDEVVIEVNRNLSDANAEALARRHRLTRLESLSFDLANTTMLRWRISDRRSVAAVVRALESDNTNTVRSAQPNYLYALQQDASANAAPGATEGDPAQYAIAKLNIPLAHSLAKGDKVLVAVIDSGVDAAHPELAGVIADHLDLLEPGPPHAHGTAIAGAIASHSRLMGIAPAAQILAIRAFGPSGGTAEGTTFNILRGLDWAVAKGARIINMSFAGPSDPALSRSLMTAREKGVVLIAAAGNAGPKSPPLFPAADANVIAVTATDAEDKLFAASNRGNYVAVAAPGVDILLPAPEASYQVSSGTSFAAAHVSGIAALLLDRNPKLGQDAVRKILSGTAKDLGPKGRDSQFGAGLADAYKATTAAKTSPAEARAAKAVSRR